MSDSHAFAASIVSRYGRRLRQFISSRVRNTADVPDLAQEVFLRLLRIDNHESIRSPESYLLTIASHVLHQHALRRSATTEAMDIDELLDELQTADEDDPVRQADTQLRIEHLQRALKHLSPAERSVLLLHRLAGFSLEEIARQIGVARPTAKKYLAKALVHCRTLRERAGEDPTL